MSVESFDFKYMNAPVVIMIDIDNDGDIIKVCHKARPDIEIDDIPDDMMLRLYEDTSDIRYEIMRECSSEAEEYERHVRQEISYLRSV